MTPRPPDLMVSRQAGATSPATGAAQFPASLAAAVERCWRKASAPTQWNLTLEQFTAALERSVARRFPHSRASTKAIEQYLEALHASDLALALACGAGNAVAWDLFVAQFRPELYRAAQAIVGRGTGDADARDLADSLYAELYGLRESEGNRKSLFEYFHGRSKLATWLRAVLAQRYVDEIRRARRTEPLENESGEPRDGVEASAADAHAPSVNLPLDAGRAKYLAILQAILTTTIGALDARDRLRLAYYYTDDRTLAEIGKLLGEHEATVSRKLDRTRREVRERVQALLRDEKKMSAEQVRLCCEYARDEWPFDLTVALRSAGTPRADASERGKAPPG